MKNNLKIRTPLYAPQRLRPCRGPRAGRRNAKASAHVHAFFVAYAQTCVHVHAFFVAYPPRKCARCTCAEPAPRASTRIVCVRARGQMRANARATPRRPRNETKMAPRRLQDGPKLDPICPQMAPRSREMTPQGRQSAPKIHRERSSGKHTNTHTHTYIHTRAQKQKSLSGRVHREARGIPQWVGSHSAACVNPVYLPVG